MAQARLFQVENRLAIAMRRPGGKSFADLLHNAERRVSALRETCVISLGRQVERMSGLAAAAREVQEPRALDDLYAAANGVFAIAAAFELRHVAEAAYELCDLAEHFRETGDVVWPAIDVYVDGLRLLLAEPTDADAGVAIRAGLRRVRSRFLHEAPRAAR
jgi:hypothetical protein